MAIYKTDNIGVLTMQQNQPTKDTNFLYYKRYCAQTKHHFHLKLILLQLIIHSNSYCEKNDRQLISL